MKIKKEKLYLESGHVNMEYILNLGVTYTAIVAARGVGKTYGTLKYLYERGEKFLHLRRTQTQTDLINMDAHNNFLKLNEDLGINIHPLKVMKGQCGYFECDEENKPLGDWIGLTGALSTMHNLRGVADDHTLKWVFYDEFIPMKSERPIKEEYDAFANMLETFGRNRELEGEDPLRVIMCANSNKLNNPIFNGLGVVNRVLRALNSGREFLYLPDRDFLIIFASNSEISERKKETSLYRFTKNTGFDSIALENAFTIDDRFIGSRPLKEYKPVAVLGPLCVYKHKSKVEYYITPHISGTPPEYPLDDSRRFFRKYSTIYDAYAEYKITYSDYLTKGIFDEAIN